MTRLAEGLLTTDDPPVKVLFVYGANPTSVHPTRPACGRVCRARTCSRSSSTSSATDTVDWADIVLPATMQTEHLDVHDGYGHMYVSLNRPAVAAPGECLPRPRPSAGWRGRWGWPSRCCTRTTRRSPAPVRRRGPRAAVERRLDAARLPDAVRARSPTASPRPRASSSSSREPAAADGHDPLPGYVPPALSGDAPLSLIAPASHWFLNSMFANKPDLMKRAGEPRIELHVEDAIDARDRDRRRRPGVQRPRRRSWPWRRSRTASGPAWSPRPRGIGSRTFVAGPTSTPPWRSATPTSAAGRSSTTTVSRSNMSQAGKEVRLASRPTGEPDPSNFELAEVEVADPGDGEIVVRNTFMSVDPYMRGRMNAAKSYAAPYEIGQALWGGAVGEVVASRDARSPRATSSCTSSAGASTRCCRPSTRARSTRPACRVPRSSACSACPA